MSKAAETSVNYRFSGHEDQAMVRLGVGKNMVRAIRFWTDVAGMSSEGEHGGSRISDFGAELLGEAGYDPFLEDMKTLWLIHWKISTSAVLPMKVNTRSDLRIRSME